ACDPVHFGSATDNGRLANDSNSSCARNCAAFRRLTGDFSSAHWLGDFAGLTSDSGPAYGAADFVRPMSDSGSVHGPADAVRPTNDSRSAVDLAGLPTPWDSASRV